MKKIKSKKEGSTYTKMLKKYYEKGISRDEAVAKILKLYTKAKKSSVVKSSYYIWVMKEKKGNKEKQQLPKNVQVQEKQHKIKQYTIDEFLAYRRFLQTGKIE